MPRPGATALFAAMAAMLAAAPAGAIVQGTSSTLGSYTVRLVGAYYCSGVVIARRAVVTAAHCGRGMRVLAAGRSFGASHASRSAVLDDGRRVEVRGDAIILHLSSPLPATVAAAPVGDGAGDSFVIAGYGTTDERWRGSFGKLHEAHLVNAGDNVLVDPNRSGNISASACFGDSGGPVLRGGELVGIITRAAHPSPRIACGDYTRWAPIRVTGMGEAAAADAPPAEEKPRRHRRRVHDATVQQTAAFSWFGQPAEAKLLRRSARHKEARQ
ncbi:MAG TPA: S1 family peptidase [Pseudolabrys sp.]|nr:S1 family peptidase [Pseudolabrys sp.]